MADDEYLWPERGHRFFEFERTRSDAYTWMRPSLSEYGYMYRHSSERLIDLACTAPGLLNVHAIPAVFLFRHFIELSLKDMISAARFLDEQPPGFPDTHHLAQLWSELRTLLGRVGGEGAGQDAALLGIVGEMITELDTVDPESIAFRYPRGRRREGRRPLLEKKYEYFDMRAFRDQALRLAHFIDGTSTQLDEWMAIKRDLDREYRFD